MRLVEVCDCDKICSPYWQRSDSGCHEVLEFLQNIKMATRPGAEVFGTCVLEYIFKILVEIMVKYSYSYSFSIYSDFTSTSEYFFNMIL